MKTCTKCGDTKEDSEFYFINKAAGTHHSRCKECVKAYSRQYKVGKEDRYRDASRKHHLKKKFNLSVSDFDRMFTEQDGRCAICNKTSHKILCVDHDHTTGSVRDLLCDNCNKGLGNFFDNPEIMLSALSYLGKHKCA